MDFTMKELAEEYLDLCQCECDGDMSVGISPCKFYEFPDIDVVGGCKLKRYLADNET